MIAVVAVVHLWLRARVLVHRASDIFVIYLVQGEDFDHSIL